MPAALVARSAETAAVRAFLERALTEPTAMLIEGEAGIGKSTLLWEAAETGVGRGFRVLSAVASQAEARYAYTAVADLLGFIDAQVLSELPEAQQEALGRILLGGSDGPAGNERMVATALLAVIRSLSSVTPVLICLDDVQWLDASSRAVIGFVARRLSGRVGLLVAVRTDTTATADLAWLTPARPDSLARLRVSPLSLGGVHALVSARLGRTLPRPTITRIHETSGGNPFFALELARFIAEHPDQATVGLPDSLAALVRDHTGDLDGEAGQVLLAAACAAAPTIDLVSVITDVSPGRVVEVIESERIGSVAEVDGNRIRFRHPLFATGVLSCAGPSARRAMHHRFADIVEEPELKARHLALAATTGDPETVKALDAAAEATEARGAPSVAAELLELAVKLGGDTPIRRLRAAEMHFRSGAIEPARDHLQSTIEGLPSGSPFRCMALMALAAVTGYGDSLLTAVDLLRQAVDSAEDPVLQLHARLLLTPLTGLVGDLKGSVELARIAVAQAEQLDVAALHSQALTIKVLVSTMYGLGIDHQDLQRALDLEDPASGAAATFRASAVAPMIRCWSGELEEARDQMRAVHQRFVRRGTEIDILWAANHVTMIELWSGRLADAAQIAADCRQRAEQMGGKLMLVQVWVAQAAVAAYQGREDDARTAANAAIEAARTTGAMHLVGPAETALAFLEASRGDYAAAISTLAPMLASFDADHDTEIVVGAYLPDAVEALTALGRLDEAEPLIAALERNGARLDRPWMLAVGARGRGHWFAAAGDLEAAEQVLEDALQHHERLPMPFEAARTRLLLGQVQRRRRRRQHAHAALNAALATFETLGTPLWAQRARAELDRLTVPAPGGGLTAAEGRVAERAAAGLSNKQIAAELFIAAKTVEMTLSSVYRKLGIRSRAGLSAALNPD